MLVTRLLHASLHTPGSLEACHDFYKRVLGLRELTRPDLAIPGKWFSIANAALHLNGREVSPVVNQNHAGSHPRHLCFGVEDLQAARASLEGAGANVVEAGSLEVIQLWATDPAGNVLEFQESRLDNPAVNASPRIKRAETEW